MEHSHQVVDKLALALCRVRPCGRGVIGGVRYGPGVGIARLDDHYLLVRGLSLQQTDRPFEFGERTMKVGIVAQSEDVVVDLILLGARHKIGERGIVGVVLLLRDRDALGMEDDARLGALLSADLRGAPQQTGKALPVGLWRIGIASLGVALRLRSPQHAVADLVARLDEVGRGPLGLQAAQHPARILRQRVGQRLVVEALPCPWRPLLGRVGPGVAIVEVE